jgi:hypothetical protein
LEWTNGPLLQLLEQEKFDALVTLDIKHALPAGVSALSHSCFFVVGGQQQAPNAAAIGGEANQLGVARAQRASSRNQVVLNPF